MDTGDVIAIFAIAVPIIVAILGFTIKSKNDEIKLLEAKNESQSTIISQLQLQNMKLEVTGTLVNKYFSELPQVVNEIKRENRS